MSQFPVQFHEAKLSSYLIIISPVQMKSRHFGVVSLVVGEVKVIWQRLLLTRKSAKEKQRKSSFKLPSKKFHRDFLQSEDTQASQLNK